MLERFPGHLEQQALLGIHRDGLARGDAEEGRVEPVDVFDEAAAAGRRLARRRGIGIVERIDVPAVAGNLADRVDPVAQQAPEALGIRGAPREAAAHADDREGLDARRLEAGDLRLQRLHRDEGAAQRGEVVG